MSFIKVVRLTYFWSYYYNMVPTDRENQGEIKFQVWKSGNLKKVGQFQGKIREFDKRWNKSGNLTLGPHDIASGLLHCTCLNYLNN